MFSGRGPSRKRAQTKADGRRSGDGEAWDAYIWVTNVDTLAEAFRVKNARVVKGPCETDYHIREVLAEDLDAYRLCFGQDHLEGLTKSIRFSAHRPMSHVDALLEQEFPHGSTAGERRSMECD